MVREFRFYEPINRHGYFSEDLRWRAFVSADAKWLAVEYEDEVTMYDVTGRRTVWCWVVVMGLVFFSACSLFWFDLGVFSVDGSLATITSIEQSSPFFTVLAVQVAKHPNALPTITPLAGDNT